MQNKTVSILGCGWFGLSLAESLIRKGFHVKGSSTREEKMDVLRGQGIEPYLVRFDEHTGTGFTPFFECDVLVICIPPNRKSGEAPIYPEKIGKIKEALLNARVSKVVFVSSTGVYPDNNMEVDESIVPQPDSESGRALLQAESIIRDTDEYCVSVVRFGGLIGPGRNPGRFFAGKSDVPNGLAPVNLIHQKDCVGVVEAIIDQDAFGHIFNVCSEEHPAKMDFYMEAARSSGLQIPQFTKELKQWKIVRSIKLKEVLNYYTGKLNEI